MSKGKEMLCRAARHDLAPKYEVSCRFLISSAAGCKMWTQINCLVSLKYNSYLNGLCGITSLIIKTTTTEWRKTCSDPVSRINKMIIVSKESGVSNTI